MRFLVVAFLLTLAPVLSYAQTRDELLQNAQPMPAKVTCYAPGPNDNIEGPWATSRPRPDGGGSVPMTLDCVRLGQCKYVTLAANTNYYGRYFYLGDVTYTSPIDEGGGKGKTYTLNNVIGYVHDTGSAFRSGTCAKYNTCGDIDKKFDIALGDFRGWNSRNASWFVDSQPYCRNRSTTFYLLGSEPVNPPQVGSRDTGNPGVTIVPGSPEGANLGPYSLGVQPYAPVSTGQNAFSSGPVGSSVMPGSINSSSGAVGSPGQLGSSTIRTSNRSEQSSVVPVFPLGKSAGKISVQPETLKRGGAGIVSWTSVNMTPRSCAVKLNGRVFAQENEGTKRIPQDVMQDGSLTVSMQCTTAAGSTFDDSRTIPIE